jgi:hypothetical protein
MAFAAILTDAICTATGLQAQDVAVSVGSPDQRSTWRVEFLAETTEGQRAAAESAMAGFEAPASVPERRLVPKSLVISRLIEAGKIAAARAALEANDSAYARWWAPDRPAIYADDPEAIALLTGIGADCAAILSPA